MNIEQLAILNNQSTEHISLAARAYESILFRRKEIFNMFNTQQQDANRRELVMHLDNVKYINDAFSTNPNMTWFTMEEMSSRIVWIVSDEEGIVDYNALIQTVREKVIAIVAFGKRIEKIKNTFVNEIDTFLVANNCAQALQYAHAIAQNGDAVLFSPANGKKEDISTRGSEFAANVLEL